MEVLKIVSDDSDKNRSCSSVHKVHVPNTPAVSNNTVWVARSLEFETQPLFQHLIQSVQPTSHFITINTQYKNKHTYINTRDKSYSTDLSITKVVNADFNFY